MTARESVQDSALGAGAARGPVCPAPVFVLAPARSCSTVTLALLGGHPDIHAFPELLLFEQPTLGALLDDATPAHWAPWRLDGLFRAIADVYGNGQDDDGIGRAHDWVHAHRELSCGDLMRGLLDRVGPRVGVEKSPGTTNSDEALERCRSAFPRARLLHLTRHPVATQRSMREHWGHRFVGFPTTELTRTCATAWFDAHRRIDTALGTVPRDQWIRVRAEDLLADPRIWLPRILNWLGLSADVDVVAQMLHTEQWRYAAAGPIERRHGGDPKFMRAPSLRTIPSPGPVRFPREWRLHADMERRMIELAAALGY